MTLFVLCYWEHVPQALALEGKQIPFMAIGYYFMAIGY